MNIQAVATSFSSLVVSLQPSPTASHRLETKYLLIAAWCVCVCVSGAGQGLGVYSPTAEQLAQLLTGGTVSRRRRDTNDINEEEEEIFRVRRQTASSLEVGFGDIFKLSI